MSLRESHILASIVVALVVGYFYAAYLLGLHEEGRLAGAEGSALVGKSVFFLIGYSILGSIAAHILTSILYGIVTGRSPKQISDERDRLFELKAVYFTLILFSIGFTASMALLGWGNWPEYVVFLAIIFCMYLANLLGDLFKFALYRMG